MRQVLAKGAHSAVYIDDENPNIIIKVPDPKDGAYIQRQMKGFHLVDSIKEANVGGVLLPELIEIKEEGGVSCLYEKKLAGVCLGAPVWQGLSEVQKNNIARKIAVFLNSMHSCGSYESSNKLQELVKSHSRLVNADEIIAQFDGTLPKNIEGQLRKSEAYLQGADKSDEVIVMTHSDMRSQNILYDAQTDNVAILDFELAKPDNVYRDFIPFAAASIGMPWDFTRRVIAYYNQLPNKKYPIHIDEKKVQNGLFYGAVHEYARCLNFHRINTDTRYYQRITDKLELITGLPLKPGGKVLPPNGKAPRD